MNLNDKLGNRGLWVAIGSLVVMVVTDFTDVTPDHVQQYVNIGLAILAGAGVISNPKEGKGFTDEDYENVKSNGGE